MTIWTILEIFVSKSPIRTFGCRLTRDSLKVGGLVQDDGSTQEDGARPTATAAGSEEVVSVLEEGAETETEAEEEQVIQVRQLGTQCAPNWPLLILKPL